VVAGEVRNLAMRAADAARNTSHLIEGRVKKIRQMADLVMKTSETFSEVSQGTRKVGGLLSEIAVASNEQAKGIERIDNAVDGMDKIAQQNAASAGEPASASEELSALAVQMKEIVAALVKLIGENGEGDLRKESLPSTQNSPDEPKATGPRKKMEIDSDKFPYLLDGQFLYHRLSILQLKSAAK
jgi:hypothetical protein